MTTQWSYWKRRAESLRKIGEQWIEENLES